MRIWMIGELALVVLLGVASMARERLGPHYQRVSMAASALLVALCVGESLVDGIHPWTVALGVVAIVLFVVELARQARQSPG